MDILIETLTGAEIARFLHKPDRIKIPGTNDVVFPGDEPRPIDIGDDHFLATLVINEPDLGVNEKRGPETITVADRVVTLDRATVAMTEREIADTAQTKDEEILRNDTLKLAHILIEVTRILLMKEVIVSTDFSAATERMYQATKTVTDRLNRK